MAYIDFGNTYFLDCWLQKYQLKDLLVSVIQEQEKDDEKEKGREQREQDLLLALLYNKILEPVRIDQLASWLKGNYGRFLFEVEHFSLEKMFAVFERLGSKKIEEEFFSTWTHYIIENVDPSSDLAAAVIPLSQDLKDLAQRYGFLDTSEEICLLLVFQQSTSIPLFYKLIQKDQPKDKDIDDILIQAVSLGLAPKELLVTGFYGYGSGLPQSRMLHYKEGQTCHIDFLKRLLQRPELARAITERSDLIKPEHLHTYRDRIFYLMQSPALENVLAQAKNKAPSTSLYLGLDLSPFKDEQDYLYDANHG